MNEIFAASTATASSVSHRVHVQHVHPGNTSSTTSRLSTCRTLPSAVLVATPAKAQNHLAFGSTPSTAPIEALQGNELQQSRFHRWQLSEHESPRVVAQYGISRCCSHERATFVLRPAKTASDHSVNRTHCVVLTFGPPFIFGQMALHHNTPVRSSFRSAISATFPLANQMNQGGGRTASETCAQKPLQLNGIA